MGFQQQNNLFATENPLLQNRFFAGMAASTEAILLITTQSTRIAISTVHKLKINCLRFIPSSSCPSQNYVALSFPGGENLNLFPSIHRSSFLALILCCCWDPKDMNSQLFPPPTARQIFWCDFLLVCLCKKMRSCCCGFGSL